MDTINKEMKNLKVAFDMLEDGDKIIVCWNKASSHLVFDTLMTLECKYRWVKDGYRTPESEWSSFSGVISRKSACIAPTYAALNYSPIFAFDVQNAYLQSFSSE